MSGTSWGSSQALYTRWEECRYAKRRVRELTAQVEALKAEKAELVAMLERIQATLKPPLKEVRKLVAKAKSK